MFPYDRAFVTRMAEGRDFPKDSLEKVLRLSRILVELGSGVFAPFRLVLKGGTALHLGFFALRRLSVDIDLDLDLDLSLEEMSETRIRLEKEIKAMMEAEGYVLDPGSRIHHALSSFGFLYTNLFGGKDRIEIEINYVNRIHILEPIVRTVSMGEIPDFAILSLAPKELFASKIAALVGRGKPRDVYDAWLIEQSGHFRPEDRIDLRRYALFYTVNSMEVHGDTDLFRYIQNRKEIIQRKETSAFDTALRSVLRRSDPIDEMGFRSSAVRVMDALFLSPEIQANPYFSAYQKGVFDPALLFRDSQWNPAMINHPMALWKTGQIRRVQTQ